MRGSMCRVCSGWVVLAMLALLGVESRAQSPTGVEPRDGTEAVRDTLSADQERLLIGLLNTSLESLAEKSRRSRRIGGYAMVGLGIGAGLGGAATLAVGEGDDARIVGYALLGGGALLGGLSLLPFKLRGESERIYAAFRQMPAGTPDQVRQKYYYWDRRFEELAQKRRRGRIIGGITSMAVGVLTGIVAVQGSGRDEADAFLWPALGPVLGGMTSLLVKSDAEQRYDTYRRSKEDVVGRASTAAIRVGVAPLPTGEIIGIVQVRW